MKKLLLSALFVFIWLPITIEAQISYDECNFNSGTWVSKTPMPEGRALAVSSVIDGKIYSTCGYYDYGLDTMVNRHTLFVYDPVADTWDTTGMPIPYTRSMENPGQSVVDGKWYVVGGIEWERTDAGWMAVPLARVDAYDPGTDSWELKAFLPEPMGGNGICTLDGKLYVTGGISGQIGTEQIYKSVYMYDPASDTWEAKADMNNARSFHVSLAFDGKIYVFGGNNESGNNLSGRTVEVYDPELDQWALLSPKAPAIADAGGCVVDNTIYLFGGIEDFDSSTGSWNIWKYYPEKDQWSIYGRMPESNYHHSVCEFGGKIYVIGGRRSGWKVSSNVDEFELSELVLDELFLDKTLGKGETISLDLSQHFSHIDGEPFNYTICQSYAGVVSDSIDGDTLILTGMGAGRVDVWVRAESGKDVSGDKFQVEVLITGISEQDHASTLIQLFPNPAGDILTVQLQKEGIYEYSVYSVNGQQVLVGILEGSSHTVDVSILDRGMYFIKVSSSELAVTRKFLKIW